MMSKNKKIIFSIIMAGIALAIMLFASIPKVGGQEVTISDLVGKPEKFKDKYVETQGLLAADKVQWDSDKIQLKFEIYDENNDYLPIFYKGVKPDNFSNDVIVIVDGYMNESGVLEAEKIQTKCPSKYEGKDMKNYDPKLHQKVLKQNQD